MIAKAVMQQLAPVWRLPGASDAEDYMSETTLRVLLAARRYESQKRGPASGRPASIVTFLHKRIHGAPVDLRRTEVRFEQHIVVESRIPHGLASLKLARPFDEGSASNRHLWQKIQPYFVHLTHTQRYILRRHYFDDAKFREISKEVWLSLEEVEYLHTDALKLLRSYLPSGSGFVA